MNRKPVSKAVSVEQKATKKATDTTRHSQPEETRKASEQMSVAITPNGPYRVQGSIPLTRQIIEPNKQGESWNWREEEHFEAKEVYLLCRCGGSANKPFCDGTHRKNGFDGTETAENAAYLEQAQKFAGPERTLTDAEPLCAFARF